jgi:hypothetical protein
MFTLQARGLLSLNHAAFRALGQPEHVALLYDSNERIVALRKVDKEHSNAYRVREQGGSYLVGTQAFISYHGIKPLVAQRFVAHRYGGDVWGFVLSEGRAVTNRRGAPKQGPARTDRWRTTTDGFEVPALMRMRDATAPQPAWRPQVPVGNEPPSMRVGALVACEPLGHTLPTSELRQRFLNFMDSSTIAELVTAVSHVDGGSPWKPWAGNGRLMLEAGLTHDDTSGAAVPPTTWARLLLPEVGMSSYGRDPRFAEIIVHIEPRGTDGGSAEPVDIAAWHKRFTQALAIPGTLAEFLSDALDLDTADDPPAQLGISLMAPHGMAELVDLKGLKSLEGSSPSPWYMGWALADPAGQPIGKTAVELLRQMCDYTLHVDEYELVLESLNT